MAKKYDFMSDAELEAAVDAALAEAISEGRVIQTPDGCFELTPAGRKWADGDTPPSNPKPKSNLH